MKNCYTAVIQRGGKWFFAFCPEVPEANGQARPREECLESLSAAIGLILDYRREESLENAPRGAEQTRSLSERGHSCPLGVDYKPMADKNVRALACRRRTVDSTGQ